MQRLIALAFIYMFCVHAMLSQSPSDVSEQLRSVQGKELKKLLYQIRVPHEIADYYSFVSIEGYRWLDLQPQTSRSLHVLVLPCSSILGSPILLLSYSNTKWSLRDQDGMDCHYDDSANAQLVNVTSSSQYDLLLHHSCASRGSGYVEQLTRVLRLEKGKFHQVFEADDVVHSLEGENDHHGAYQESTFLPTRPHTLEETRVSTTYDENDQPLLFEAKIERRQHIWNGQAFSSSPWKRLR